MEKRQSIVQLQQLFPQRLHDSDLRHDIKSMVNSSSWVSYGQTLCFHRFLFANPEARGPWHLKMFDLHFISAKSVNPLGSTDWYDRTLGASTNISDRSIHLFFLLATPTLEGVLFLLSANDKQNRYSKY